MRNPDRTYTTLRDRAEYLLADQIKSMNYHRKHSKTAIDTHLRQTHINQMSRQVVIFSGMAELFEATFRDYAVHVEINESDEYYFWIEAR